MKSIKLKICAAMSAAVVLTAASLSASADTPKRLRDANGDGSVELNDAITTRFYLLGRYNPTNIKSFDFDGNGIISAMDMDKIQHYLLKNIDANKLPDPSTEVVPAAATSRTYMRHDCSNSNLASYSEYTLTVDPFDNTLSNTNISPYNLPGIIGDNDMKKDSDTAVVILEARRRDGSLAGRGTGFIVNDHIVATAAHCIYDYENNTFYKNYYVDLTDSNNNTKSVKAKYVDICKDFSTCGTKYGNDHIKYDYALLYFDEDLSEYGELQMGVALDEYVSGHGEVTVSGFPGPLYYPDEYKDDPSGTQFKADGKIFSAKELHTDSFSDEFNICYDADTGKGHSGGPVYAKETFTANNKKYDYRTVIAINAGIYDEIKINAGVKITPDILKFYNDNPNIDY